MAGHYRRSVAADCATVKKPNVVYLLADQLRARSLPAYGERQIATPNIDRIAREGITFSNAVATCPLCAPYRSMLDYRKAAARDRPRHQQRESAPR